MRVPTEEETRAENYRHSAEKRKRAIRERKRKLRGDAGARATLERNWKPLICDTSITGNRK